MHKEPSCSDFRSREEPHRTSFLPTLGRKVQVMIRMTVWGPLNGNTMIMDCFVELVAGKLALAGGAL